MQRTSGDAGFDLVVGGGLPVGALVIVAGPPGSGKTILAQQICFANATSERKALYYTTWSEPHDKMVRHLEPFTFFDVDALGERVEFVHLAELIGSDRAGRVSGPPATRSCGRASRRRPSIIVIDSSKALHDVDRPGRASVARSTTLRAGSPTPTPCSSSSASTPRAETRSQPEFAVADGIVQLENEPHGPVDRRWLRVLKMRGAESVPGQHSFRISGRGIEVFPRFETTRPRLVPTLDSRAPFGLDKLDSATGGGIPRGDSTLLIGPSGVGKTLLALRFVAAGLEAGERCLHISFQETETQVRDKVAAAGWDWTEIGGEQLVIHHIPPVEIDLDEVGALIRRELAAGEVKRVVIDSLAELAFAARQTERLPGYVWALGGFVRAAGGTTLFTNEMAALGQRRRPRRALLHLQQRLLPPLHRGRIRAPTRPQHPEDASERPRQRSARVHDRRQRSDLRRAIEGVSGLLGWSALRGDDA